MAWTLRKHNLLGISPARNQIKNIGADEHAEHGGTSLELEMTQRFCGMDSLALPLPLRHPAEIVPDKNYERKIAKIRSEEHTSELQSRGHLVCRLLLEKKNN